MKATPAGRNLARICLLLASLSAASAAVLADGVHADTIAAFDRYVRLSEQRIARQVGDPKVFLYVNTLSGTNRKETLDSLRRGEIYMTPLLTPDARGGELTVPGGM